MSKGFPKDENGYIVNIGSKHLIQSEFIPVLEKTQNLCKNQLGNALVSFFVIGSVSCGKGYPYFSDLDLVVVTDIEQSINEKKWTLPAIDELVQLYPVITDIDLTLITLGDLLYSEAANRLRVNVATQSALLFGRDIYSSLPKFGPNRELALYIYPNLENEFINLRKIFTGESNNTSYLLRERSLVFWCVWTMRTLLRSAHALAMITTGLYNRELKACLDGTIVVYPNLQKLLEYAYRWALSPVADADAIIRFLDGYLPIFLDLWHKKIEVQ